MDNRTELEVTTLAGYLGETDNWDDLHTLISKHDAAMARSLLLVKGRPELHDKLWRYIELFRQTTQHSF